MAEEKPEVRLSKKSFLEYCESRNFTLLDKGSPQKAKLLELVGGVSNLPFSPDAMVEVDRGIIMSARNLGANAVFGIEYKAMADGSTPYRGTLGYGDAYEMRNDPQEFKESDFEED